MNDILNEYWANSLNQLLKHLKLDEVEANEIRTILINSKYQQEGSNRKETTCNIICKNRMLTISFEKKHLTSSGWINTEK